MEQQPINNNKSTDPLPGEELLFYLIREGKEHWYSRKKFVQEVLFLSNKRVIRELPQQGTLQVLFLEQLDHVEVVGQYRSNSYTTQGVGVRHGCWSRKNNWLYYIKPESPYSSL